ncbi:unnamed protein product [Nesidiocoris tenuis]|uniref:Uncharacterized protein n=1 Tax=Nesidiocoris tenuis TaxID=355587 RepID=A0A6H5HJC3_9HEMI|nr:unnamed protein product [Nesidiocoris tenuis]
MPGHQCNKVAFTKPQRLLGQRKKKNTLNPNKRTSENVRLRDAPRPLKPKIQLARVSYILFALAPPSRQSGSQLFVGAAGAAVVSQFEAVAVRRGGGAAKLVSATGRVFQLDFARRTPDESEWLNSTGLQRKTRNVKPPQVNRMTGKSMYMRWLIEIIVITQNIVKMNVSRQLSHTQPCTIFE